MPVLVQDVPVPHASAVFSPIRDGALVHCGVGMDALIGVPAVWRQCWQFDCFNNDVVLNRLL